MSELSGCVSRDEMATMIEEIVDLTVIGEQFLRVFNLAMKPISFLCACIGTALKVR